MLKLTQFNQFLDDYLNFDKKIDISKVDPYMTNGMMVRGKEEVEKIGFGVSASISLFEKAKNEKCDAIIVHHSFNLPPFNRYDSIFQNRLGFLIKNEISLFGYHFLLDAHPEIGNNIEILKTIGAKPIKPFLYHANPWGWVGETEEGIEMSDVIKKFGPHLSPRTITYVFGPKHVKRIVVVSGKGAPTASIMEDLVAFGVDLYITGEAHEWNRELFREAKINFIAGGHYHTEVFGVKALMGKVKKQFIELDAGWIDVYNDI